MRVPYRPRVRTLLTLDDVDIHSFASIPILMDLPKGLDSVIKPFVTFHGYDKVQSRRLCVPLLSFSLVQH